MNIRIGQAVSVRRTGLAAMAAVTFTAADAPAFYWKGWPGARVTPHLTLLSHEDVNAPGSPPGGGGSTTPPELIPTPPPPPPPPPVGTTPEPSTLVAGLAGLVALGAYRRRVRAIA